MGANNQLQQIKFYKSVVDIDQVPSNSEVEIAFIGRSNAGKSSALNAITGIRGLARVSKTPGRTQSMNYFAVDNSRYLVDLPGYGYAKVPKMIQERWSETVEAYLHQREQLHALVLLMDVRHPLKESDMTMIHWASESDLPLHILLTKSDKISYGAGRKVLKEAQEVVAGYHGHATAQLFSSLNGKGVEEAVAYIVNTLEKRLPMENE